MHYDGRGYIVSGRSYCRNSRERKEVNKKGG